MISWPFVNKNIASSFFQMNFNVGSKFVWLLLGLSLASNAASFLTIKVQAQAQSTLNRGLIISPAINQLEMDKNTTQSLELILENDSSNEFGLPLLIIGAYFISKKKLNLSTIRISRWPFLVQK